MKKTLFAIVAIATMGLYSFIPANKMAAVTLDVNTKASRLDWSGSVKDHSHPGVVPIKSGSVTLDGGKLIGGKFVLDVAGLKSTDGAGEKLDGHLKSPDYLDVAKYPEATFEIKSVTYTGEGDAEIAGDLTAKGVTTPIKFPAKIRTATETKFFAEAFFSISKKVLGIVNAADDIQFGVHITAKK
jgi:polyisoprenoid-binding protein YceI